MEREDSNGVDREFDRAVVQIELWPRTEEEYRTGGSNDRKVGLGFELGFEETELKLAPPGSGEMEKKRAFSDRSRPDSTGSSAGRPTAKAQVVGWPPVRSFRKNVMKSCRYVKVAVDGAPYLRKVDLELYDGYELLLSSLATMFSRFIVCNYPEEMKLVDTVNGTEYVPTYEDKDGDWMLVGDVPWKMFAESCKRLRLMKSTEAVNVVATLPLHA